MRSLTLSGRGKTIDLYPWLSARAKGTEALAGIVGFGMPDLENFWTAGAGTSRRWRGSKVTPKDISLPVKIYAKDREELTALVSDLAVALDPFTRGGASEEGAARLTFGLADGTKWYRDVVRSAGLDWPRKKSSDDETFIKTSIVFETTDSFWTRTTPDSFEIGVGGIAQPLLPKVAELSLSSTSAFGQVNVINSGDAMAWAEFIVYGPANRALFIGNNGETVSWYGNIDAGNAVKFNMRNGTVTGSNGANRYAGLEAAPFFWAMPPGESEIIVQIEGATASSKCVVRWSPRRWAVV
jgi:hypothetical protein